ncbi:MAG: hypothetical protein FWG53_08975 [Clostridiales bacterium]|nr:hypothetical protein [Clostridiales bacterium]
MVSYTAKKRFFCSALAIAVLLSVAAPICINEKVLAAAGSDRYIAVAAGECHSLAIKDDGSLWAWGLNTDGQLGDGTTADRRRPVKIMDGVVSVAAGSYHSLAIKEDGSLWAWGWNGDGQIGNGAAGDVVTVDGDCVLSPVKVMDDVTYVAAGFYQSFAIAAESSLWAWGWNGYGSLGDGTMENRASPVKIMDGAAAVASGDGHSLAIKTDGSLWVWGWNSDGQLGDGTTTTFDDDGNMTEDNNKLAPVKIMDGVVSVAAGSDHSLAIKNDGSLWAWGWNGDGQLGDGTFSSFDDDGSIAEDNSRATPIKIMDGVVSAAAGSYHSLAIKEDGSLWAFGWNGCGQLGDGTVENKAAPVKITGGAAFAAAGYSHSLVAKEDGSLWAWGSDDDGQLGDGKMSTFDVESGNYDRAEPVKIAADAAMQPEGTGDECSYLPVEVMGGAAIAAAGCYFNLVVKTDGSLWAWGANDSGQLGDGTVRGRGYPVKIMNGVAAVSAGKYHSLAVKTNGSLWAWGNNDSGELGKRTDFDLYKPAITSDNVSAVAAGSYYSLSIKTDGSLWSFGWNGGGRLGNGKTTGKSNSTRIMADVAGIAAGDGHSFTITADGRLLAFGRNDHGQLGDGTITEYDSEWNAIEDNNRAQPTEIMNGVAAVAAGSVHSIAVMEDGSLWCWGENNYGQLGDGTVASSAVPVKIMDSAIFAVAGDCHSLAIKSDGSLWAWGDNRFGQLGDGTDIDSCVPVKIMDDVVFAAAGNYHSIAIKSDGSLWTWGDNHFGQLGNEMPVSFYLFFACGIAAGLIVLGAAFLIIIKRGKT